MPPRQDAAAELANEMFQVLEVQKRLGADAYPLPLRRLAQLTSPAAPPELVLQAAAKKKVFAPRVLVAEPRNLDAPVALAEDAPVLAASPLLLDFVLASTCSPQQPTLDVARPKTKLPVPLRQLFVQALQRRIQENTLPPTVALITIRKKQHLHLLRYPLPRERDVALAEALLRALHGRKNIGGDAYPSTLDRLLEQADPATNATLRKKAVAQPLFQQAVVVACPKLADTPLALKEDIALLASSALLLDAVLRLARSEKTHAFSATELKAKVALPLKQPLAEALDRRVRAGELPPGVGCILQKGKPLFFPMSDVRSGAMPVAADAADFARQFEHAFSTIEGQARMANFVSLVELRSALPFDRPTFDAELRRLRLAGRYTLSAAEGRYGISADERAAGIQEDGALLLYVSRKTP